VYTRVGKCYPGRAIVVFPSEAKDFSRGGQNDEILFFPLETKKTTFLLKINRKMSNLSKAPFYPSPFDAHYCVYRPITSLGHQRGEEFSERRNKCFKPCPIFLNTFNAFFQGV